MPLTVSGMMLLMVINMSNIKSSYKKFNYSKVFQSLCFSLDPKLIVEFGF